MQVTVFLQLNIIDKTSHGAALSQVPNSRAPAWSSCVCPVCSVFSLPSSWWVELICQTFNIRGWGSVKKGLASLCSHLWASWQPPTQRHQEFNTFFKVRRLRFTEEDIIYLETFSTCILTNHLDPPMSMFPLRENCSTSRDPLFLIKRHKIIICLMSKHWHSRHPLLNNLCLSAWLIIQLLLLIFSSRKV